REGHSGRFRSQRFERHVHGCAAKTRFPLIIAQLLKNKSIVPMKIHSKSIHSVITILAVAVAAVCATTASALPIAKVVWISQPSTAVYGSAFNPQPVLETVDQNGVFTTNGLPAHLFVTISATGGTLTGTTIYDIGSSVSNGVVTTTGLGFF